MSKRKRATSADPQPAPPEVQQAHSDRRDCCPLVGTRGVATPNNAAGEARPAPRKKRERRLLDEAAKARKLALQREVGRSEELADEGRTPAELGLPPDYWLPYELAAQWRSTEYPTEPTRESVAQWEALLRATAAAARRQFRGTAWETSPGGTERHVLEGLLHDKELLRQHDPALVRPPAPNRTSGATAAAGGGASTADGGKRRKGTVNQRMLEHLQATPSALAGPSANGPTTWAVLLRRLPGRPHGRT
jgi:hypothetical protein